MTPRHLALATLLAALPAAFAPLAALAQAPDFGDDTSAWANDGECDDSRFEGEGMAQTLLDVDVGHDASDCRALFESGLIQPVGGAAPAAGAMTAPATAGTGTATTGAATTGTATAGTPATTAPATPTTPPVKGAIAAAPEAPAAPAATATISVSIQYGDDAGAYPNDGECDDRRFVGPGVATAVLDWTNVGHDATDCRTLVEAGQITLWDAAAARAATQCTAIDFGTDSNQYSNDGECDDIRFEGPGSAFFVHSQNTLTDAADCQALCDFGGIALRDY